ncbi:hypothetical protein [Aureimonas pseudogalii]|uniref:Uncharacterized protein n=1 Tax=Aureimonas pseudogalii TaxID=1744844 RepID=A0A7W6H259_9HYPH|nr:hypothetical protein [Aureimonas pseudogalii]MBB3996275.1 hypothetical protein [Aureimonas pseudogalii]
MSNPNFSPAARRRRDDWRADLAPIIEGHATLISRRPGAASSRAPFADPAPATEPRWAARLEAANSNRRPPPRPRTPRHPWLWTALSLQTGAALAGLAVLALVVFPSGMTDTLPATAPPASTIGSAR